MKVYLVYNKGVVESVHATLKSAEEFATDKSKIHERELYGDPVILMNDYNHEKIQKTT